MTNETIRKEWEKENGITSNWIGSFGTEFNRDYVEHLEAGRIEDKRIIADLKTCLDERRVENEELGKQIKELNKLYTESDLALQKYMRKDEENQETIKELKAGLCPRDVQKVICKIKYEGCKTCLHFKNIQPTKQKEGEGK